MFYSKVDGDQKPAGLVTSTVKGPRLSALLSPLTFVAFVGLSGVLLSFTNPLSWGEQYGIFQGWDVILGYVGSLLLGLVAVRTWTALGPSREVTGGAVSDQWLKAVFICACIFTIAKFINVRDIPLFGDPMSRYRHTIGGYADYFARLITPLALLYFYKLQRSGYKDYGALAAIFLSVSLSSLFMQRQDVLFVVIGCITIWAYRLRLRFKYALVTAVLLGAAAYVVVGLGALARYGADRLANDVSPLVLPFWIIHGEFTVPYRLGDYVTRGVDELLLGRYSLGQYFTIFGSDVSVGAGYINANFVGAETAQSIGAPYSFLIDFGSTGALVLGFLTGLLMSYAYHAFNQPNASPLALTMYPMLLLQAFWSVRSGEFLVSSFALFGFLSILVSTTGGSVFTEFLRAYVRPFFIAALALAAVTLAARI